MLHFILSIILFFLIGGGEAYVHNVYSNVLEKFGSSRKQLHVTAASTIDSFENDLLALDFDGVVCDSSPESSVSAIKAIKDVWNLETTAKEFETVKNIVMSLRPIIETGYENILIARLALDEIRKCDRFDIELMLRVWGGVVRDSFLMKYDVEKEALIDAFGKTRDKFIAEEFDTWLDLNPIYPGIEEAFQKLQQSNFHVLWNRRSRA